MGREQIIKPASAWLGTTIFSLLTGIAFGYGVFLTLFDTVWHGLFFIVIAIAFACLCWLEGPQTTTMGHRLYDYSCTGIYTLLNFQHNAAVHVGDPNRSVLCRAIIQDDQSRLTCRGDSSPFSLRTSRPHFPPFDYFTLQPTR